MKRIKLDPTYTQERMDEDTEVETVPCNITRAEYPKVGEIVTLKQLFRAAESGDYEKLAELCSGKSETGENFGQELKSFKLLNYSFPPLHIAVVRGYSKCVKILIEHGVDMNSKANHNITPLQCAVIHGKYKCLRMLLEAGADSSIPIEASIAGNVNNTALLHLAAKYNQMKCIEVLIQFGADCYALDERGRTSLFIACNGQFQECVLAHLRNAHDTSFINVPDFFNNTPLHLAVIYRMTECVQELVRLGADINYRNQLDMSALHLACCLRTLNVDAKKQILKIFLLSSHNTDVRDALHSKYFLAYDREAIKVLIAYGADINVRKAASDASPFEKIINWNFDSEVLEYCTNCMPRLPLLPSVKSHLNFYAKLPEKFLVYNQPDLPESADVRLARKGINLFVEVTDSNLLVSSLLNTPVKKYAVLEQPFLDVVYNHVDKKLNALSSIPDESESSSDILRKKYLNRMQNFLWYQKTASCPRTLQQHCRFTIRKCMGPTNIKHIKKLPLPQRFKSYLLFNCN